MSCYFRYLKDVFAEAGIRVTPDKKRTIDQAIHTWAKVAYKHCMPDCWSKVKPVLRNASKCATLIATLKRLS